MITAVLILHFCSGELERKRFGYLDRESNFSLIYDPMESDDSVYPSMYF